MIGGIILIVNLISYQYGFCIIVLIVMLGGNFMNNKGFTLIELVATLVILGLVASLGLYSMNFNMNKAKEKTEEVFVDTLRDAIDVYISSEKSNLKFNTDVKNDGTDCTITKKYGSVSVEKATTNFRAVINSKYKPITESEFVNPANEDVTCDVDAEITIYRDEDFVYYYSIDKSDLICLKNIGDIDSDGTSDYSSVISNLPEGYDCD